jgi:hypothetical protein
MSRYSNPDKIAIGYDLEILDYYGFIHEAGKDMSSKRQKGIKLSELYNYNCCLKPNSQSYADNQLVRYEDIMPTGLKNFGYIMWSKRSGESRNEYAYYDYTDCDIYTVDSVIFDIYDDFKIPNFNGNNHYLLSFSLSTTTSDGNGELFFTLPQYYGSNSEDRLAYNYIINNIKIYKYNYSDKTFTEFRSDDNSTTGGYKYICGKEMFYSYSYWQNPWYWCEKNAWPSYTSGYDEYGINPLYVGYDYLTGCTAFRIRDIFGLMGTVNERKEITYKINLNVSYYPQGNNTNSVTKDIELYITVIRKGYI